MALDPDRQLPFELLTANALWFDALLRHQIFLLRASGSIRNEVLELLNDTENEISQKLREGLRGRTKISPRNFVRATALIKKVQALRAGAWNQIDKVWLERFQDLSINEVQFLAKALNTVLPVQLVTDLPDVSLLKSLVKTRPFEGRVLANWSKGIHATDLQRIHDQVRIGMVQGESSDEIARRVVGTARRQGRDGILQLTRNNAAAITRTAVIHFSNQARQEFLLANSDIFEDELYVATLDSRTTAICRSFDGETFPVGQGPQPPLHFQCRSLRVATIGDVVGSRPTKPVTDQMLLREFARSRGMTSVPRSRAKLPHGTLGKFDAFSRRRVRELIGSVPAKVSYPDWIRNQSREFQNDTLGITKAKLFRDGKLPLDKFVNRLGDELTISELASREAAAFRAAGLDPKKFAT